MAGCSEQPPFLTCRTQDSTAQKFSSTVRRWVCSEEGCHAPNCPPQGCNAPGPPPPPRAFTCTPWQPLLGLRVTVFTASLSLGTPRSSLLCSGYTVRFFLKQTEVVQKSFVNTSHISLVLQSTCWSPSLLGGKGRQNVFHTLVLLAA